MRLTWLGHSACHLEIGGQSILIDPWFEGNPSHPEGFEGGLERVDAIVLTHGHEDHGIHDAPRLAKRFGAPVIAMFEIVSALADKGVEAVEPMNIGGTIERDGIRYTMVNALHSSDLMVDGRFVPLGNPAGFVIKGGGRTVYHAGDTDIFSDMALIQRIHEPTVGLIPIGDRFTMGPETAAMAVNEFLELETIIPIHYGTFPELTGRAETFRELVQRGEVRVPAAGEAIEL